MKASDTLTVMVPFRVGQVQAEPWRAERTDTATASGVRIFLNGRSFGVAFRKTGADKAEWGGANFDGPVLVKTSAQ